MHSEVHLFQSAFLTSLKNQIHSIVIFYVSLRLVDGVDNVGWLAFRATDKHWHTIQLRIRRNCRIFVCRIKGVYRPDDWSRTGIKWSSQSLTAKRFADVKKIWKKNHSSEHQNTHKKKTITHFWVFSFSNCLWMMTHLRIVSEPITQWHW